MNLDVSVVWFPVSDLERSLGFYEQTLGLKRVSSDDDWAELESNGLRIGLNAHDEESPHGDGGGVLAFSPDGGIEETVRELTDRGVKFDDGISDHPWGRVAAFTDPDGNALQLYEAPSPSRPGN